MTKPFNRRRSAQLGGRSIPQLFAERCAATPDAVAFRYKDLGIYREVTWREYREQVETLLAGLEALGLRRGECVAMMSDPCAEFYVADMAGLCAGAICYGIYTTCSIPEVHYQLDNGRARVFFAENQEFVDKALSAGEPLPELRKIVVFDTRAIFQYDDPRLISFADLLELGRARLKEQPDLLQRRVESVCSDDIAVLVYTSGTTGPPKGAMHDHSTLMWGFGNSYLEAFPELNEGVHRAVSHLPIAHLIERSMSLYLPLVADVVPHAGEEVEDLRTTLHEVRPTFLNVVPRILEKMAASIVTGVRRSSWLKRTLFEAAMRVGERYRENAWDGKRAGVLLAGLYWLARIGVFTPMLRKAGLSELKAVLCAGAALPAKVQAIWQIWGVNVRNLYGITEGGYALCQVGSFPRPGAAGRPIFPQHLRLDTDGEILLSGKTIFRGYWQNEAATSAALVDGWLHTGDLADMDAQSNYRVIDRKKDIMITSGGKNIAPTEIESLLKSSLYISEAMLVAEARRFVSALIEIDFSTVSEWARSRGVLYTSFNSLATHPRVVALIEREIDGVNAQLARVEQVKKFRIIPKELDPEEGDTTPTRKVKRQHLCKMYGPLIEQMYAGEPAIGPARTPRETEPATAFDDRRS
jgi:long-chain acyl-CoA synthetase